MGRHDSGKGNMKKKYQFPNTNRGKEFTVNHTTERFIHEVLRDQAYKFIDYYPVVIDIGANIGTFSIYMHDKADQIFAVEPIKENVELMQKTIKENGFDKISVTQCAISNNSFVKKMQYSGSAGGGAWRLSETGDYLVPAKTLEDFMDDEKIDYADLVKIDVEGHELEIFSTSLFPADRIGTMIGELHKDKYNPDRIRIGELLEWMGFNYRELPNDMFIARK